jgi:Ankyrin repeats (many copies)
MSSSHSLHVAVEDFNPLHDPDTRAIVFSFLGAGQGAFIKIVSKACKSTYEMVHPQDEVVLGEYYFEDEKFSCTHDMTLLSAALASPAKLRLSLEWGLQVRLRHNSRLVPIDDILVEWSQTIGRLADYNTLLAAEADLIADLTLSEYTLAGAAASGDVQKMIRLHAERGCALDNPDVNALTWAARGGSVQAMIWLRQQGCKYDSDIHAVAAYKGKLNVLQYLEAEGHTLETLDNARDAENPCEEAAGQGHLEVLQWLHEHGWPWGRQSVCQRAALGGSVAVVQYLQEQGLVLDEEAMAGAARGGQLHMCQYLIEAGCPWDARACTEAIEGISIPALRWLHENGFRKMEAVNLAAATSGSIEMIEYLWAEGAVPNAAVLTRMLSKACARDDFATVQWLRKHGAQWPAAITTGMQSACFAAFIQGSTHLSFSKRLLRRMQEVTLLVCLTALQRV